MVSPSPNVALTFPISFGIFFAAFFSHLLRANSQSHSQGIIWSGPTASYFFIIYPALHSTTFLRKGLFFWTTAFHFFFCSFLFFFERHAELNSKNRPLGTAFTCLKIKRSLLNLFVVAALCFEKSAVSEWYWLEASIDFNEQLKSSENRFRRRC